MTDEFTEPSQLQISFPEELGTFDGFCLQLRHKSGLSFSTQRHILLAKLCHKLRQEGIAIKTSQQAVELLSPVIAADKQEQIQLQELINSSWKNLKEPDHKTTSNVSNEQSKAGVPGDIKLTKPTIIKSWTVFLFRSPWFWTSLTLLIFLLGLISTSPIEVKTLPPVTDNGGIQPIDRAEPSPIIPVDLINVISNEQFLYPTLFFALLFGTYSIMQLYRKMGLAREMSLRSMSSHQLFFEKSIYRLFDNQEGRRAGQLLSRHIETETNRLDIKKTIGETIKYAGSLTPYYKTVPRLPEYLILVDKASANDHLAIIANDIQGLLESRQLHVECFNYFGSPERARSASLKDHISSPVQFGEILAKAEKLKWLLIADTRTLFSPGKRKPMNWLQSLAKSSRGYIISPLSESEWGWREKHLSDMGVDVVPTTSEGLTRIAHSVYDGLNFKDGDVLPSDLAYGYTDLDYLHSSVAWLHDTPPDKDMQSNILLRLKLLLSRFDETMVGYDLFAALCIYPELTPTLTSMIADAIRKESSLPLEDHHLGLVTTLPWMRQGRIPTWLRTLIIEDLYPEKYEQLDAIVKSVLGVPLKGGTLPLTIITDNRWLVTRALAKLLPADSIAAHDAIFLRHIKGRNKSDFFEVGRSFFNNLNLKSSLPRKAALFLGLMSVLLFLVQFDLLTALGTWFADNRNAVYAFLHPFIDYLPYLIIFSVVLACSYAVNVDTLSKSKTRYPVFAMAILPLCAALLFASAGFLAARVGLQPIKNLYVTGFAFIIVFLLLRGPTNRPSYTLQNILSGNYTFSSVVVWIVIVLSEVAVSVSASTEIASSNPEINNFFSSANFGSPFILLLAIRKRIDFSFWNVFLCALFFMAARSAISYVLPNILPWPIETITASGVDWSFWAAFPLLGIYLHRSRISLGFPFYVSCTAFVTGSFLFNIFYSRQDLFGADYVANLDSLIPIIPIAFSATFLLPFAIGLYYLIARFSGKLLHFELSSLTNKQIFQRVLGLVALFVFMVAVTNAQDNSSDPALDDALLVFSYVAIFPIALLLYPRLFAARKTAKSMHFAWPLKGNALIFLLAPILMIFPSFSYGQGPWSINWSYLILPIAMWLGRRFGARGFITLLIGAWPYLIGIRFAGFSTANDPGLYIIALILCRFAGIPEFRLANITARHITRKKILYLFIGLTTYASFSISFNVIYLSFGTYFINTIFFIVFLFGVSQISLRSFMPIGLSVWSFSFLLSLFSSSNHFPRLSGFQVWPTFDGLHELIAVFIFFKLGQMTRRWIADKSIHENRLMQIAMLCIIVMVLDRFSIRYNTTFDNGIEFKPYLSFVSYLVPMAFLFFLGLFGGARGFVYGLAVIIIVKIGIPVAVNYLPANLLTNTGKDIFPYLDNGMRAASFNMKVWFFTVEWQNYLNSFGARYLLGPTAGVNMGDFMFPLFGWLVHRTYLSDKAGKKLKLTISEPWHDTIISDPVVIKRANRKREIEAASRHFLPWGVKETPFFHGTGFFSNSYFSIVMPIGYLVLVFGSFLLLQYGVFLSALLLNFLS